MTSEDKTEPRTVFTDTRPAFYTSRAYRIGVPMHPTDHSRGTLPPAETLQYEPAPREPVGWLETIGTAVFLILWVVAALLP